MGQVTWTERARADFREIVEKLAATSAAAAGRLKIDVANATSHIGRFPLIGRRASEIEDSDFREIVVGKVVLAYRIDEDGIIIYAIIDPRRSMGYRIPGEPH